MTLDVLVISPFRRPTFRKAISERYPVREPWDSPPLIVAGGLEQRGLTVGYLALQNLFDSWEESRDLSRLREILMDVPTRMVLFTSDYFIPSRSTATLFGIRVVSKQMRAAHAEVIIGVAGRLATTAGPHLLDQVPECDFLVHGEPESVVGDIAAELLEKGVAEARHPSLVTRASTTDGQRPHPATTATLDETPCQRGTFSIARCTGGTSTSRPAIQQAFPSACERAQAAGFGVGSVPASRTG